MKGFFVIVMLIVAPLMSFAGSDSGWAERGNGNEFFPPECHQDIVDPRQPIRPVTEDDILRGGSPVVNPDCLSNSNLIGPGQPKINN